MRCQEQQFITKLLHSTFQRLAFYDTFRISFSSLLLYVDSKIIEMFCLSVCSLTYDKQNPDSCLRTSESWYALNASDPDLNKCCCLAFCTIQFVKQIIVNAVISGLLSVTPNNHVKIFCETRSDPVFSYYKSLCLKIPSCKSDYIIYNQMIFVRSNHTHMSYEYKWTFGILKHRLHSENLQDIVAPSGIGRGYFKCIFIWPKTIELITFVSEQN